jgi:hypothetical protein
MHAHPSNSQRTNEQAAHDPHRGRSGGLRRWSAAVVAGVIVAALGAASQGGPAASAADGTSTKTTVTASLSETTTPKATFASGSGANFFGVKVSQNGNLLSFEAPQGQEAVFTPREGYAVCSQGSVHGADTGDVATGFGAPSFVQPTAGAFPLTITRSTLDGKIRLKQVWAVPDAGERDGAVTMTVTNVSASALSSVLLTRSGDFDVGSTSADRGAGTVDSVWLFDDRIAGPDAPASGVMLSALTRSMEHVAIIERAVDWAGVLGTRGRCSTATVATPTGSGDFVLRSAYLFGTVPVGGSRTVKFEYRYM